MGVDEIEAEGKL